MEKRKLILNNKARALPFWSWNDKLDKAKLLKQVEWMHEKGFGGFFMHARAGLKTEYLGEEWFDCINACAQKAKELGMQAWAYDENGWPSGFVGGKLLAIEKYRENYLSYDIGEWNENALVSYDISQEELIRVKDGQTAEKVLNVYLHTSWSTVDILDEEVIDSFLKETHERYKTFFGGKLAENLEGFFTDEPQYYARSTPYPHKLTKFFKETYGEDILNGLGLLFVQKKGYKAFRYKFWLSCQRLFLNNFSKKIFNWCEEHGVKLTGHYLEEAGIFQQMLTCAGIMPFYEYQHIPGIDWLCRRFMSIIPIRQIVSVGAQLGKKDLLTEAFAMTGWDATPIELKAIAEFQFMYGINILCHHLVPYSEVGERKNDYPAHFSKINPWVEESIDTFNRYFDLLGALVRESEEEVEVAVLHPVRSMYIHYAYGEATPVMPLERSMRAYSEMLAENHIAFHYLDETILEKYGFVDGAKIACGKTKYKYLIIIPETKVMGKTTEKLIRDFVGNGGKLLLAGEKPTYLEGEEYDYSYMQSSVSLEEIKKAQKYQVVCENKKVRTAMRKSKEATYVLILNTDMNEQANCTLNTDGELTEVDILGDKLYKAEKTFTLQPLESKIFMVNTQGKTEGRKTETDVVNLPIKGYEVVESSDNYFVLDKANISYDGKKYSAEEYPLPAIFEKLIKERYSGNLYLKFNFSTNVIPSNLRLMYENCQETTIFVNGQQVIFNEVSSLDEKMLLGDISPFIRIGKNEIVQELYYYQSDKTYTSLFGDCVTEGLKNCVGYDTYFESLRLVGDFGVFAEGGFKESSLKNVFIAESFVIDQAKKKVDDLLFDGYIFFAGKIRLRTFLELATENTLLRITGRIHYARVFVNDIFAGEYFFNDVLDISKWAVKGKNKIEVELFTGNRNLFGPFHMKETEESFYVTPSSFTFEGKWKGFECERFRKSYSFVRTGIFESEGQFRLPAMDV